MYAKYVIFTDERGYHVFLFGANERHCEKVPESGNPVGAGVIDLETLECSGSAISLGGVRSRGKDDERIVRSALQGVHP